MLKMLGYHLGNQLELGFFQEVVAGAFFAPLALTFFVALTAFGLAFFTITLKLKHSEQVLLPDFMKLIGLLLFFLFTHGECDTPQMY